MLTAKQVLDEYFLENRCALLEIAAMLDRYDTARDGTDQPAGCSDPRLERIYQSLRILADRNTGSNRAEQLLRLFSDPTE